MKTWHLVLLLFAVYMIGIYIPGPGQRIRAYTGF